MYYILLVVVMQRNFKDICIGMIYCQNIFEGKLKFILINFFFFVQRKFVSENGYFEDFIKLDFWDKFVDFVNIWNKISILNKWVILRFEDELKYNEILEIFY